MSLPGGLGIVVGLAQEARCAKGLVPDTRIGVSGATRDGAERAIGRLIAGGATHLLSFGLAGGLDPRLRPGALLIPGAVHVDGASFPADPALLAVLRGRLPAETGPLLHSDELIGSERSKRQLHALSFCCALDMESGHVARLAIRHGCGFAVLRVVCDAGDEDLPPAARIPLDPDGRIRPGRILGSIVRHPGQLPGLIRLGRNAALARTRLRRSVESLRTMADAQRPAGL